MKKLIPIAFLAGITFVQASDYECDIDAEIMQLQDELGSVRSEVQDIKAQQNSDYNVAHATHASVQQDIYQDREWINFLYSVGRPDLAREHKRFLKALCKQYGYQYPFSD